MSKANHETKIIFSASKVYAHRWPLNSQIWSQSTKENVDLKLNYKTEKKEIVINDLIIRINNFEFDKIKKVGVTVPLFKKETRMVFEGHFEDSFAHVHITTNSQNYLEIFNKLMMWKNKCFPEIK